MAEQTCKSSSLKYFFSMKFFRASSSLAAILGLLAAPLLVSVRAQDSASLDDLIPDSAVSDPEGWAAEGVPAAEAAQEDAPPEVEASDPLPEMADITVPWPDNLGPDDLGPDDLAPDEMALSEAELEQLAPLEGEEPVVFVAFDEEIPPIPAGSEERISDELVLVFPTETSLFPQRDEFLDRFKSLSIVEEYDDEDNLARLTAQSRDDEALLIQLLRTYGYFDAQVVRSVGDIDAEVEASLDRPAVRFDVLPSVRYTVGAVDLGDLAAAGEDYPNLRQTYGVFPGDPISLDLIQNERFDLDRELGETGYPFAAIADPELLVDHARQEGDVAMPVTPGGKYNFGVVVSSDPEFLSGDHLTNIARWQPGEIYQRSDEMDLRRAILATGLVGAITLTPVEVTPPTDGQPGIVNIEAGLTRAPLRTLAGGIGYGTEEGIRLEGSWEHRNLFPPEGSLRVRGIVGTQEQLAGVTLRKNNFGGRDRILSLDAFFSTIDYDAYDARTISLVGSFERVSTLLFQKQLGWSIGLELVATQESELDANGIALPRETYFIAALPIYAQLDTSDDLLDPTEGWRLGGRLSPEVSRNNGVQSFYVRSQVDASYYQSVGENVVLAGRARFASIPGAEIEDIAPSRRLYAGGGGSVRGYGYRQIGPLNDIGDPIGGRSLTEFSLEARVRTGLMDGAISVVPFIDAGTVGSDAVPGFDAIKLGAGVGLRYHTGFGPLRLDVAMPLNPGPNDSFVAVYVALGQAF